MNKQIVILILLLVSFITTPLGAQESCYEQYLREHNMKILTAEDADDSYDELKKTVLAKQMYGDSYLLMVDSIAQRAMITKVDGTYIADIHVALVDSTWYMWLSVDPLADKNIANTPYMYCNGNPIMLIDPDGRDTLHFDADGNYTHRVQSDGSHVGIWHKSNNSTREFRFQDPNDANRFITKEEYDNMTSNSETSANDWLLGIMPVLLSSVYKATRPSISDRLKGRYIAALSSSANGSMDYMRLNEPNYNMAEKAQLRLMLVDGIPLAQQPYNMGNMLWGLKMHRLGFSLPECLFGAHAYTIYGGMTGKYPKIELDSFDDQCSIILGFMLWPGF